MSIGKIIGVGLFAAATAAIWLWPEAKAPEVPDTVVRPVRSCVVSGDSLLPELRFSGKIRAGESRTLCFKQTGRIERIPVVKGQRVKKGEKLAWLFSDDYKNRLEEATASAERDRLSFKRISDAAKKNAVSQEEVSRAEAQLRQSEANLSLAKRALEDTVIIAPFDGTVADVPATELDMVSTLDSIVVLQDMSKIKVDVAVPETIVILQRRMKYKGGESDCKVDVIFDSLPDRRFPVKFVEYTAAADEKSQTYTATYIMDPVRDLLLLPGMSATISVPAGSYYFEKKENDSGRLDIPESAVGVDGAGGYYAWRLDPEGDVFVAHKVVLKDCFMKGETMSVGSGIKPGDRLATAGITVLTEGRKVTLL